MNFIFNKLFSHFQLWLLSLVLLIIYKKFSVQFWTNPGIDQWILIFLYNQCGRLTLETGYQYINKNTLALFRGHLGNSWNGPTKYWNPSSYSFGSFEEDKIMSQDQMGPILWPLKNVGSKKKIHASTTEILDSRNFGGKIKKTTNI